MDLGEAAAEVAAAVGGEALECALRAAAVERAARAAAEGLASAAHQALHCAPALPAPCLRFRIPHDSGPGSGRLLRLRSAWKRCVTARTMRGEQRAESAMGGAKAARAEAAAERAAAATAASAAFSRGRSEGRAERERLQVGGLVVQGGSTASWQQPVCTGASCSEAC